MKLSKGPNGLQITDIATGKHLDGLTMSDAMDLFMGGGRMTYDHRKSSKKPENRAYLDCVSWPSTCDSSWLDELDV
jgi:hypothetical protein